MAESPEKKPQSNQDGGKVRTTGDNPVDSVDNISPELPLVGDTGQPPGVSVPHTSTHGGNPVGSDIARQALQAAREKAKANGARNQASRKRRTGTARRRRWSGAGADDRDPQPLSRLVAKTAADRNWGASLSTGKVFANWAELVGPELAQHITPVQLKDKELTVQAESTAWATQVRLLRRQLLNQIASGVGKGLVTSIKVAGPAAPSWRHGSRHVPGRGPRDTYG